MGKTGKTVQENAIKKLADAIDLVTVCVRAERGDTGSNRYIEAGQIEGDLRDLAEQIRGFILGSYSEADGETEDFPKGSEPSRQLRIPYTEDHPPVDGEAPAPADGEAPAPADGEALEPAEGEGSTPADGEALELDQVEGSAPAEGEASPPIITGFPTVRVCRRRGRGAPSGQ